MRQAHQDDDSQAPIGRVETLGAWLHVWTPPKGATVPPVPTRKLVMGVAVTALALGALAAWLVPRIEQSKRATAQADRRTAAAVAARERARLAEDQRLHTGRVGKPDSHPALVLRLEQSITLDARQRVGAHTLKGPILRTSCQPYRLAEGGQASGEYECTAVTSEIAGGARNVAGTVGYPFWARIDFRTHSYVWCKINRNPGERAIGGGLVAVPLPAACDLARG